MEFTDLNWFDIAVLSTVFISTMLAFFRGFIKALFSLITWTGAFAVSIAAYPYVSEYLSGYVSGEKAVLAVSALSAYIVSFIIIALINSRVVYSLRRKRGGVVDRTLGFAFGLARGVLIVCLVFFSINITSQMLKLGDSEKPGPQWFTKAKTYNILKVATSTGESFVPDEVMDKMVAYIDSMKVLSSDMVEKQLGASPVGKDKALTSGDLKMMKKVISVIPKEDLKKVYDRYEGSASGLSELEKMSIFREILVIYVDNVKKGGVKKGREISDKDLKSLNDVLNPGEDILGGDIPQNEGVGYEKNNVLDMERLIGTVGK